MSNWLRPDAGASPGRLFCHVHEILITAWNEAWNERAAGSPAIVAPGGRNAALNHATWTLGHWVTAGALEQGSVEKALYTAAELNALVADDGQRQTWATIRSGIGAGI